MSLIRTTPARVANLTKRTVDAARPGPRRYVVWDAALKGFGLRVEPARLDGTPPLKTFIARYRAGGGRSGVLRQATIGRYGTITPEQARKAARALLGAASAGADPIGDAHARRLEGLTVNEVCDWYLTEADAGRLLGRGGRALKASTVAMDRSRIESHVRRLIGTKRVAFINAPLLEEFQADIAGFRATASKKSGTHHAGRGVSGGPGVASRTLAMVSAIFGHAVRRGVMSHNPARGVRKIAARRRHTRLTLDEVRILGAVMQTADEHPSTLAAIKFLLMSGVRRSEALPARHEHLLWDGGLRLEDTKVGFQIRPIGRAAMEMFRLGGEGWLFPNLPNEGYIKNLADVLTRVSKKAGLTGITPHVLRHSYASIAAELGFSELVVAGLLGHVAGTVTRGYIHIDRALVTAADRVAGTIARALAGEEETTVVDVPIRLAAG